MRSRQPVRLLWHEEFEGIAEAFWWEKRSRNRSRAQREALMRGDHAALRPASRKRLEPRQADETP
ncbi:hypothetical protein C5C27_00995 [Rathayibacter sp. AY2B7]|nr:hypothetical protein C5C27_00995 [Rathayibacter sp. AY2B7]